MIYKWYQDAFVGNPVPQLASHFGKPFPVAPANYTLSSTHPSSIKILMIGMSPNLLKVGDSPTFSLTYQNISGRPIYVQSGCGATPLGMAMSPSDSVIAGVPGHISLLPHRTCHHQSQSNRTDFSSACIIVND